MQRNFLFGALVDEVKQIAVSHQLHDDKVVIIILKQLDHAHHMRIVKLFEHFQFLAHQILIHPYTLHVRFVDDFDSYWCLRFCVNRLKHCAECTAAEFFPESVLRVDVYDTTEPFDIFVGKDFLDDGGAILLGNQWSEKIVGDFIGVACFCLYVAGLS